MMPSDSSSHAPRTLYLAHTFAHTTRVRLDGLLAAFALSSLQYTVLSVVASNEGLSSSRLSRRFNVTPQAMGEVVMLLERKGLIVRYQGADNRRVRRLALTADGRTLLGKAELVVRGFENAVISKVSPAEHEFFRALLIRLLVDLRNPNP